MTIGSCKGLWVTFKFRVSQIRFIPKNKKPRIKRSNKSEFVTSNGILKRNRYRIFTTISLSMTTPIISSQIGKQEKCKSVKKKKNVGTNPKI